MDAAGQLVILYEVTVAMLLGGAIGLEREIADKPAGLRTHMLVAAASALLVGLGNALLAEFSTDGIATLNADPIRIVQAIVMGIGFLGAGTIIRGGDGDRIEGLTTGASLLFAAALGICVAVGQIYLALGGTGLALIVLFLFGILETRFAERRRRRARDPNRESGPEATQRRR